MAKKVITPVFRVSFPAVFTTAEPMKNKGKSDNDGGGSKKPKYEITMIFDPRQFTAAEKVQYASMKAILDDASLEKFKKKVSELPANFKKAIRDGMEKEHLGGFGEGKTFAKASSFRRPGVVDTTLAPITDPETFYAGCYARATVTAYSYDNVSKGVAFGLSNVMFVKDGERLDGGTSAEKDFGEAVPKDDDSLA